VIGSGTERPFDRQVGYTGNFVKYSNAELMEVFAKMHLGETAAASPILEAPEHIKWSIVRPVADTDFS